jgi:hypothetical protein
MLNYQGKRRRRKKEKTVFVYSVCSATQEDKTIAITD